MPFKAVNLAFQLSLLILQVFLTTELEVSTDGPNLTRSMNITEDIAKIVNFTKMITTQKLTYPQIAEAESTTRLSDTTTGNNENTTVFGMQVVTKVYRTIVKQIFYHGIYVMTNGSYGNTMSTSIQPTEPDNTFNTSTPNATTTSSRTASDHTEVNTVSSSKQPSISTADNKNLTTFYENNTNSSAEFELVSSLPAVVSTNPTTTKSTTTFQELQVRKNNKYEKPHDTTDSSTAIPSSNLQDIITRQEFANAVIAAAQGGIIGTLFMCGLVFGVLCSKGVIRVGSMHASSVHPEMSRMLRQAWEEIDEEKRKHKKRKCKTVKTVSTTHVMEKDRHSMRRYAIQNNYINDTEKGKRRHHTDSALKDLPENVPEFISPWEKRTQTRVNIVSQDSNEKPQKIFMKMLNKAAKSGHEQRQMQRKMSYMSPTAFNLSISG
ncbi:uncharacterized protein LOC143447274 [Clavelina lepadiformis]|uniref:Uncharacterized protein n=1 Tax=Clavelina lepadiformis TaxID=159417 RepID=A0ABP0GV79_CLALP